MVFLKFLCWIDNLSTIANFLPSQNPPELQRWPSPQLWLKGVQLTKKLQSRPYNFVKL